MSLYLPYDDRLNISVLSGFFKNVSASYKFVYFLSILEILKKRKFSGEPISLKCIEKEMLKIAWYPHTFYKLNFGKTDQLGIVLRDLATEQNINDEIPQKSLDDAIH